MENVFYPEGNAYLIVMCFSGFVFKFLRMLVYIYV